jgi:ATP-dependent Lon protease
VSATVATPSSFIETHPLIETLPAPVHQRVHDELDTLKQVNRESKKYDRTLQYVNWILSLPWNVAEPEPLPLKKAKRVMDKIHVGRDKLKEEILRWIAVAHGPFLTSRAPIGLVGPPGVGKSSFARAAAAAFNRPIIHLDLSVMHNRETMKGHARDTSAAQPSFLLKEIRRVGTFHPVILLEHLDEIMDTDNEEFLAELMQMILGKPKREFWDSYLDMSIDLARSIIFFTCSDLDFFSRTFVSQTQLFFLSTYTPEEKLRILECYIYPKQLKNYGQEDFLQVGPSVWREIIEGYTQEAGTHQLEERIESLIRWGVLKKVRDQSQKVTVHPSDVEKIFSSFRYFKPVIEKHESPGVVTGLSWTSYGGNVLFVEAVQMAGKGKLLVTGQLGKVMYESIDIALSLIRTHAKNYAPEFNFETHDLHIHVPGGSVPKDGPSAGLAVYAALVSLLTGKSINPHIAMTGEITLQGIVLPVGGVKEKVIAAQRAGVTDVILPAENRGTTQDLSVDTLKAVRFHFIESVEELRKIVF